MVQKGKLTLTVDPETIKKAKEMGINISELTETVLRTFAFTAKDETRRTVFDHYRALFEAMRPVLQEYDTSVHVARYVDTRPPKPQRGGIVNIPFDEDVYLLEDGRFYVDPPETVILPDQVERDYFSPRGDFVFSFLDPGDIFRNFIDRLEEAKRRRKERLETLEFTRKLVQTLREWDLDKDRTAQPEKKVTEKSRRRGRAVH